MNLCQLFAVEYSDEHEGLLSLLAEAHRMAAVGNENISGVALRLAASAGVSFESAVASAVLTLGQAHGPIEAARQMIYRKSLHEIDSLLDAGVKIPGWGNSFYKISLDPAWNGIAHAIRSRHPEHYDKLEAVGERIFKATGRVLYPNAAAFSAVVCEIVGLPTGSESEVFIVLRMNAWAQMYRTQRSG